MFNEKNKIGVFAPNYYGKFKCISDRCRHNCCIGWEICIDEDTYAEYKHMPDIACTVKECADGPCFELCDDGRCPHLNDDGLCNIFLSHGEKYLSEICRNHPRFYNYINSERCEVGLGLVCEVACRLILENEKPFLLSEIDEIDCADFDVPKDNFSPLTMRDRIISIIESHKGGFDEKLSALGAEFKVPDLYTPEKWLDRFLSLEILDKNWEKDLKSVRGRFLRNTCRNTDMYGKYYERLLTYFVYRHVSVADSESELRARLAFSILSVQVIRSLFEENLGDTPLSHSDNLPEKLADLARRFSAEIEYSEDNTAELVFAFESQLVE